MAGDAPKRRGRPPKFGSERTRGSLTVRLTDKVRETIELSAAEAKRSLSEEIEFRVNRDIAWEETRNDIQKMLKDATEQVAAAKIKAIRQAGLQLVRDADGAKVLVSMEHLLSEADGIIRSGFVDTADPRNSVEKVIEKAVQKGIESAVGENVRLAVAEALSEMGLARSKR